MTPQPADQRRAQAQQASAELVSARWLFSAFLLCLAAAAVCGYGVLCLLFYQGQWQLLFHPAHTVATTPASVNLPWLDVRFDVTETGQARLDGWWIPVIPPGTSRSQPAPANSAYASDTILYLHDARGSLSDCLPALASLHALGINVFAFDYQGFGRSTGRHPSERLATANAAAAWTWLTDIRHIPAKNIVVYGDGVGASLAATLAARFVPAGVILEDPNLPARQILAADPRARILPLSLLQNEFLDPARGLARIHAPLLFLDRQGDSGRTRTLFNAAPYPKEICDLRSAPDSTVTATLRRFLDEVLH
jgi:hypothetical protein